MRSRSTGILAALALLAACATPRAHGQTLYGNINQPAVSPYLNVLRSGAPPGVNYYNIVQPQLQFYSAINQLQNQQRTTVINSTNASGALVTGHPVVYSSYLHFYPQLNTGGGGAVVGGGVPGVQGLQGLQNRLQQNLPTRNLGTAPTGLPIRPR